MKTNNHNCLPTSTFVQYLALLFLPAAAVTICASLETVARFIGL